MGERTTATTAPYTVGTAPFRPGDEPVFAKGFTEQPGDLGMPDPIKATADDTMAHAKVLWESSMMLAMHQESGTLN